MLQRGVPSVSSEITTGRLLQRFSPREFTIVWAANVQSQNLANDCFLTNYKHIVRLSQLKSNYIISFAKHSSPGFGILVKGYINVIPYIPTYNPSQNRYFPFMFTQANNDSIPPWLTNAAVETQLTQFCRNEEVCRQR